MATNLRPSQLITNNGWGEKTWADIEIAQNQYDLLQQLEKFQTTNTSPLLDNSLNELIDALKENTNKEQLNESYKMDMEDKKEKQQLCNRLNIDYVDLLLFVQCLDGGSKDLQDKIHKIQESLKTATEQESENLLKELDEIQQQVSRIVPENYQKFFEFRYTHYNKEMELLFLKIQLPVFKIDSKLIKSYGTIEDYKEYIQNVILE